MGDRNPDNVSRETKERLDHLAEELLKWNKRINLIAKGTEAEMASRHIQDSYQLFTLAPNTCHWLDVGSGGGLPGLVVAVQAKEDSPTQLTTLVESDQRKCAFLRKIKADLGLNCVILAKRIEAVGPQNANIISARALAPLTDLLRMAAPNLAVDGKCLFPKGERHMEEIEEARKSWSFDCNVIKSRTNNSSAILEIRNIKRA